MYTAAVKDLEFWLGEVKLIVTEKSLYSVRFRVFGMDLIVTSAIDATLASGAVDVTL